VRRFIYDLLGSKSLASKVSLTRYSGVLAYLTANPLTLLRLDLIARYFLDMWKFKPGNKFLFGVYPILSDYNDSAGVMSGHYFHQDLYVANKIFLAGPTKHDDIGSRIDGFVAHVASFREIQIFDIRELSSQVKNVSIVRGDLMKPSNVTTDSLSCLHTLEHFGLGRYGDPIDPDGHLLGFSNMVAMVDKGGTLYLSFPISSIERVEFNAHRVFMPTSILGWSGSEKLELVSFAYVDDLGALHSESSPEEAERASLVYGCGIYEFEKL